MPGGTIYIHEFVQSYLLSPCNYPETLLGSEESTITMIDVISATEGITYYLTDRSMHHILRETMKTTV